ncbi:hypothetical protein ACHAQJ_005316 [Trichoderma viride]
MAKSITPGAIAADDEPVILAAETPAAETESTKPPVSEPKQIPDSWVSLFGGLGQLNETEVANESEHTDQPEDDTMEFLSVESPMEFDEMAALAGMPSFLEDLSNSLEPQCSMSTLPIGLPGRHEMMSLTWPAAGTNTNTNTLPSSQQHQSTSTSEPCICQHSKEPSRDDSRSTLSEREQSSQLLSFSSTLFQDARCSSQEANTNTPSNASQPSEISSSCERNCEVSWRRVPTERKPGHCDCTATISQRIAILRAEQRNTSLMPMDCVLMLEKEVEESLSLLHQCKNCRFDGVTHLLALVSVRMTLEILQNTARGEFVAKPKSSPDSSCNGTALCIGSFKVPSRARFRFLRRTLQARFHKLAGLIEEREKLVAGNKQDCFSKTASSLLGDISRSLRTIMGWIELWNAKHS